ncbi:extracellular solute-binding protein [Knoellia koreensis]|uniref:extracellular solute-binding protein n=1 Tax=Knoellia koreensis TaxID=2730921 RepID=UPI0023F9F499|nr:extracellular solute-binding protein [Knoellia sp. DB2414S]
MTRPASEAEYLASLTPESVRGLSRRTLLRGAAGAGALLTMPALLAACGGGDSGAGGKASGTITFGSNQSDAKPKAAYQAVMDSFAKANSGLSVKINTIDHNTFQENINNYLQGSPDDVFTWFAGYRMQFFASKGLIGDISDVWKDVKGMSDALRSPPPVRTASSTSCRSPTTRGPSSTARASSRRRATRSPRPSTSSRRSARR